MERIPVTRLRAYRIECDECCEAVDSGNAVEAEDFARRNGWLLRGRRNGRTVDLCKQCRGAHTKETTDAD